MAGYIALLCDSLGMLGVVFFPLARAKGPHVYGVGSVREEGVCTEVRVGADESERERVFWR